MIYKQFRRVYYTMVHANIIVIYVQIKAGKYNELLLYMFQFYGCIHAAIIIYFLRDKKFEMVIGYSAVYIYNMLMS